MLQLGDFPGSCRSTGCQHALVWSYTLPPCGHSAVEAGAGCWAGGTDAQREVLAPAGLVVLSSDRGRVWCRPTGTYRGPGCECALTRCVHSSGAG